MLKEQIKTLPNACYIEMFA